MNLSLNSLCSKIAQLTENGEKYKTQIHGLSLFNRNEVTDAFNIMYEPGICFIAQGEKRVFIGDDTFTYNANHYLLTLSYLPTLVEITQATENQPYLGVRLKLDMKEVAQMIIDAHIAAPQSKNTNLGMMTGEVTQELINAFERLVDLLFVEQDITILAPLIQKEIIYRLLMGSQGEYLRQVATLGSKTNQITKTIDWLKLNFQSSLNIPDLADMAGMSLSSYHQHFRTITSLSPLQYQKQLRLQEARQLMLIKNQDAANAAFAVGYESPSQFSREYSRLFGLSPLKDIAKLRENFAV